MQCLIVLSIILAAEVSCAQEHCCTQNKLYLTISSLSETVLPDAADIFGLTILDVSSYCQLL